jgi:hypothetical protein
VNLRSVDRPTAIWMDQRATAGAADAVKFFADLWQSDDRCFTCDTPLNDAAKTLILPELGDQTKALLAPICRACASQPRYRQDRAVLAILRAMWPRAKVRA